MTWSGSCDSVVGIVTRLCSKRQRNNKFTSSPKRPDLLWGPSRLLINRYWSLFSREHCDLDVNSVVRRLRMQLYINSPTCLNGAHRDSSAVILLSLISPISDTDLSYITNAKEIIQQVWLCTKAESVSCTALNIRQWTTYCDKHSVPLWKLYFRAHAIFFYTTRNFFRKLKKFSLRILWNARTTEPIRTKIIFVSTL
jgi:hypothetical protein